MLLTQDIFPAVYPWLFLVITLVAAFVKPKLWPFGLLCTLVSGLLYNAIDLVGLGVVTLLFTLAYFANMPSKNAWNQGIKTVITVLIFICCIALAAHLLPGFNNLPVLYNVEKSINSMPFTMYLNFDKPMILFVLLILYPTVLMNNKKIRLFKIETKLHVITVISATLLVIFSLATFLSLITIEPKLPSWWWLFALNNLLLTCVIEEVFFRGVIQNKLVQLFNPMAGLIVASFLFGIAHFSGGFSYVFVATLAGFLYGFVYLKTGKLWYAILIHFCLNMIHLYLFTYPLLKA
ncbi:CPBP family intramembrane glutamic endopeptidase [Colwellia psychrerythraea]|nr:CPBP family intramembrane glutamic endopeptidase [Colwellia psychrerythraea]